MRDVPEEPRALPVWDSHILQHRTQKLLETLEPTAEGLARARGLSNHAVRIISRLALFSGAPRLPGDGSGRLACQLLDSSPLREWYIGSADEAALALSSLQRYIRRAQGGALRGGLWPENPLTGRMGRLMVWLRMYLGRPDPGVGGGFGLPADALRRLAEAYDERSGRFKEQFLENTGWDYACAYFGNPLVDESNGPLWSRYNVAGEDAEGNKVYDPPPLAAFGEDEDE